MNKLQYYILPALLVALEACVASPPETYSSHDLSNRCSVIDKISIATFEDGLCGFNATDTTAALKLTDRVEGWSTALYDGTYALEVCYPDSIKASGWQSVTKRFDTPLDLRASPVLEYGILAAEGPGRDFVTRLTLIGTDGATFVAEAHIIPSLWRAVVIDLHDCQFISAVSAIDIALKNDSDQPWPHPRWLLDGVAAGKPLDLNFEVRDSEQRFVVEGPGKVSRADNKLRFDFRPGATAEVITDGSHNQIYNPDLKRRNTVVIAVDNHSDATALRLSVLTDRADHYIEAKTVEMPAGIGAHLLYYNISDQQDTPARLRGMRIEPIGGSGYILIDRIAFEREGVIAERAGSISACTATSEQVTVRGTIDPRYADGKATIEVRHYPHYKAEEPFDSLELLGTAPATPHFVINTIPNKRLGGRMTHLSSRMCAAVRRADNSIVDIGEPFYIENWRDFATNPYAFEVPDRDYRVTDYGAKGDGISNDNAAIQRAIDAAAQAGGGKVVLSGDSTSAYGRQYLATNIMLKSGVNLVIEPRAVLRQSPYLHHYQSYRPEYGHDNIIPGVPWTHCMYTNMPLILAKDVERVKITGGGEIRMDDTYSENDTWTHYARHCSDRIHIVPIAVCNTRHVEITDLDIKRCSNYHTIFYRADSVYIGNLKMQEVACLSGDGLSFGNAVTNVRVERCVFESNDDGIVLCSSYRDPRGGNWRERVDSIDSSVRHIEVYHSYIDCARGGGGKAIALIPWGSTNPRQDYNEIDDIEVRDCVLRGGHSVGCWADNPFDGKPFTNTEADDYAPVKNLRILDNEYLSPCHLQGVEPTTLLTDCGLRGATQIKNHAFGDRLAYWTHQGQITAHPGVIRIKRGILYQGLWLEPGEYNIDVQSRIWGQVTPFVTNHQSGEPIPVSGNTVRIEHEGEYLVGITVREAIIYAIRLDKAGG